MFGNKMDKIAKLADKNDAVKLLGMLNDKDEIERLFLEFLENYKSKRSA